MKCDTVSVCIFTHFLNNIQKIIFTFKIKSTQKRIFLSKKTTFVAFFNQKIKITWEQL